METRKGERRKAEGDMAHEEKRNKTRDINGLVEPYHKMTDQFNYFFRFSKIEEISCLVST